MTVETRERQDLSFDFDLPSPPDKVWRALTVPAYLERWLRPDAAGIEAEVIEAEPPRQLRWRWHEAGADPGMVTITLTPSAAGGTSVRLIHERRIVALLLPRPANGNSAMAMAA